MLTFVDECKPQLIPMLTNRQDKFRMRVKLRLLQTGRNIQQLADSIQRPRPSVSAAINRGMFPKLRKEIEEALK